MPPNHRRRRVRISRQKPAVEGAATKQRDNDKAGMCDLRRAALGRANENETATRFFLLVAVYAIWKIKVSVASPDSALQVKLCSTLRTNIFGSSLRTTYWLLE